MPAPEAFVHHLQVALQDLYDPVTLQRSPLIALFNLEQRCDPVSTLRQIITEAIISLRPTAHVALDSNAWRIFNVLTYRYVEQTSQVTVAANLSLSVRQLRRQERIAEQQLADYLWAHYDLAAHTGILPPIGVAAEKLEEEEPVADRAQELEWLRQSFPSAANPLTAILAAVERTLSPLIDSLGVRLNYTLADDLPPVVAPVAPVREALLNLLMAALRLGGNVCLTAMLCDQGIRVEVGVHDVTPGRAPDDKTTAYTEMAEQLTRLFGGALLVTQPHGDGRAYAATLILPVAEQLLVLAIDDNADTLRLLQRYLAGTRYRLIGVRDPVEALTVAQTRAPQAIVLDLMLPDVDGWELLGRLRAHPATEHIPIIISTILPQEDLAVALGAAAFLRKPISQEALLSTLDAHLGTCAPRSQ